MDTLAMIEAVITLGFDMRVRTVKVVRDNVDTKVVVVEIGDDISGEGLTPSEALHAAFDVLRAKVEKRQAKDAAILQVLSGTVLP